MNYVKTQSYTEAAFAAMGMIPSLNNAKNTCWNAYKYYKND